MAERLTDLTALTAVNASDDLIHIVDVSDTTQNAAGSSKKQRVDDFFKGKTFKSLLGCLVWQVSLTPSKTQIQDGDFIIYATDDVLKVGVALDTITNPATEMNDNTKCSLFIDQTPLL